MSAEDEVRKASKQFYDGLNAMARGDAGTLAASWSHSANVTAMHPIGGRQEGWDAVRESFEQFAKLATAGKVELKDQLIHVSGDMAYEIGVERGEVTLAGQDVNIGHRVTNVYQRESGGWKMIHHHTDTSMAFIDILNRLQPASTQAGVKTGIPR